MLISKNAFNENLVDCIIQPCVRASQITFLNQSTAKSSYADCNLLEGWLEVAGKVPAYLLLEYMHENIQ